MTDLSSDLQNYLSSSQKTSSSASSGSGFISLNLPTFSGYSKLSTKPDNPFDEEAQQPSNDSKSSGWFSWSKSEPAPKADGSDACACLPEMSKKQRLTGFVVLLLLGIVCFFCAFMYLPMLVFKMRKFVLLFTFGSGFTMLSFSFLFGPWNHIKSLFVADRVIFTSVYFTTLITTLYFAMGLESTILTTIAGSAQVCALLYYVISYIPGGATGLTYFSSFWWSIASGTLKNCFSSSA